MAIPSACFRKNRGLAAIMFLFLVPVLPAALIEGTVTDALNSVPVESALVQVKGTTVQTLTDAAGHFSLQTSTGIGDKTAARPALGEGLRGARAAVYGADGSLLRHGQYATPEELVAGLAGGIYFITAGYHGHSYTLKLIKTGHRCQAGQVREARAKAGAAVTLAYSHEYYTTKEASANEGDLGVAVELSMWYPDETNTGVPAGTVLQNYTGDYEVRTNGVTISGLRVTGCIVVYGNNVTVRNCEVDCSNTIYGIAPASAYAMNGGAGLKVFNCRVYGTHCSAGVCGGDEIAYCDISGVENSTTGGDNYIHDNYMHDFARWIAEDQHTDGVQTYGSAGKGGFRAVHNTILAILTAGDYSPANYGGGSSAIALCENMHDLSIDANYFAGGSYTLYGPSQAGASPANVHVTNNRFSNHYYAKCGQFGTHTGFNRSAPGFKWTGNIWYETGAAVGP